MADGSLPESTSPQATLSCRFLLGVLLLYAAGAFCATYPALLTPTARLVGNRCDPLQSLWLMHWYKDCLLHGQSPLHCGAIQYPVGAPLGNFSPLHLQALLYIPLSLAFDNDILCYNLLWFFNLCFTGLGSFVLVWYVLRDRACAWFGGLLAMLSGPVLLHANGHIELITLGGLPLFMVGWMRWVDRPTTRRLLLALALYFLVALSAAYFAVFALVPAGVYFLSQTAREGYGCWRRERVRTCPPIVSGLAADRRSARFCEPPRNGKSIEEWSLLTFLMSRITWLSAFGTTAAAGLFVIYLPQIVSRLHGFSLARPKGEFNFYGAPSWSFIVPSYLHALGHLLPGDVYARAGSVTVECCSYLGVVTLLLLGYAALTQARFQRARAWWAIVLTCAVLSFGAYWRIGSLRISLPAEWLRKGAFIFQALRVPARFNLCVSVFAAVPAAAGLRHLLTRFPNCSLRTTLFAGLSLVALADLAIIPFQTSEIPRLPACYEMLRKRTPDAACVDVPQLASGICSDLGSACTYWQAWHHGRTTAGYSGYANIVYDNLIFQPSPFASPRLAQADYLGNPECVSIDLVSGMRFEDYVWLYLSVHRLDYIVLHRESGLSGDLPSCIDRLKALLGHARIFEDQDTVVYDRGQLRPPRQPTLLCTDGWRHRSLWKGRHTCALAEVGHVIVFNPEPGRFLTLTLEAVALHRPRRVRLLADGLKLAQWEIGADALHRFTSPPFHLAAGFSHLVLESDGAEPPARLEVTYEGDTRPYSLRVAGVGLLPVDDRTSGGEE